MKKLKVTKGAKCMACLECVRACSTSFYKEFDPDKSCIQIIDKNDVQNQWFAYSAANVQRLVQKVQITQKCKRRFI